jgi:hypothetical protein
VLDTTGSMASAGKIDAMKTATKNLIDQLKDAATNPGDVYVSIVPFSRDVNAGSGNSTADWIDWTAWEDEPPYIKTNKPSNWDQIGPGSNCPFSNSNYGFRCMDNPANGSSTRRTFPRAAPTRATSARASTTAARSPRRPRSTTMAATTAADHHDVAEHGLQRIGQLQLRQHAELLMHRQRQQQGLQADGDDRRRALYPRLDQERALDLERLRRRPRQCDAPHAQNYDQTVVAPVAGTAASQFPAQHTTTARPR